MNRATRPLPPPPAETPAQLSLALVQVTLALHELRAFILDRLPPSERETRAERKEDGHRISEVPG